MNCILASMDGMTTAAFRSLCFEFGADGASTEMVGAVGFARAKGRRRPIMDALVLRRPEETGRLAIQFIGRQPSLMAAAAKKAEDMGRFDLVEINMGCPARGVVSSGNGAALLQNPALAGEILRAVCEAVQLPVRLKMRLGWDDEHITAPEIARIAQQAGCREIILHGRTRQQGYGGEAEIENMRAVRNAVRIPLYANGAVERAKDATPFARAVGADGVCIGRAALKQPWIFEDVACLERGETPPVRDARARVGLILKLAERLCQQKPEKFAVEEMRKYTKWYLAGLSGADGAFERAKRAANLDEYRRVHLEYLNALMRANDLLPHPELLPPENLDTVEKSV